MSHSSDNSSAKKLTSEVAKTLDREQEQIIREWVKRVKLEVHLAADIAAPILVNTIPMFVGNLAEALDRDLARKTATDFNNVAQEHGGERARVTDYGPDQVIQEYFILREVIISHLSVKHVLTNKELNTIQRSFEGAIRQSMMAFYLVYSELRENVVSNLTHDMRTPLAAARLTVEFIRRKLSKPTTEQSRHQIDDLISRAIKNIDYTNELIQSLLDEKYLKFVNTNKNFKSANMMEIVKSAIEDLSGSVLKQVEVSGESVDGFWDAKALRRAVENLVSNAVKYGDEDKAIEVKVTTTLGRVFVSVHNWGPAIPVDQVGLLFEAYHRAESAKDSKQKGWGLGLTFCRGVAETHGGSLGVDSSDENGTTFTIDLPVDGRPLVGTPTVVGKI
jgi:signal transduction histidine kinase